VVDLSIPTLYAQHGSVGSIDSFIFKAGVDVKKIIFIMLIIGAGAVYANASGPKADAVAENADFVAGHKAVLAKDWPSAVKALNKALKKSPENADIHNDLGYAYRNLGEMDLSFSHYNQALKINPNHRQAHEYIGEAYLKVDKLDKAVEHLARLEQICGKGCEEYEDLAKSIEAYKKK
jgi:Flp pilus assembly protein TadD